MMTTNFLTKYLYLYFLILLFIIIPDDKDLTIVVTVLGALLGVYYLSRYHKVVFIEMRENRYLYAMLAFLIPVAISMIDTLYPERRYYVLMTLCLYLLIGVLPIIILKTEKNYGNLELFTFIGVIFIALDAIFQWQLGYHILGYNPVDKALPRVYGVFGDLAHLSYFLGTLAPVVLFFVFQKLEHKVTVIRAALAVVIFILLVTGVVIGGARAGMVSLAVSVFLFITFIFVKGNIKHKLCFFIIIIVLLVLSLIILSQTAVVQDRFYQTTSNFGSLDFYNQFTSYRINLWYVGFKEVPNYWINGAGTRAFNEIYQMYPEDYKIFSYIWHPHLQGLEVLILTGIIGFIPYLILCVYLLIRMFTAKAGNVWIMIAFIALMPINTHVGIYQNFWLPMIWIPMMLGLTQAYRADN